MPRSPPNQARGKFARSAASPRQQDSGPSDSEEDEHVSQHDHSTRSKNLSQLSSPDRSLHAEGDHLRDSFHTRSPRTPDPETIGQRAKSSSPGSPATSRSRRLYPNISDLSCGDGPASPDASASRKDGGSASKRGASVYPTISSPESGGGNSRRRLSSGSEFVSESLEKRRKLSGKSSGEEGSNVLLYLLVAVLAVVTYFIASSGSSKTGSDTPDTLGAFEKYISGVNQLQKKFPGQSPRLWRTLKASARHVLNASDPDYPVVVLMAAQAHNSHLTRCIAQNAAALFESASTRRGMDLTGDVATSDVGLYTHLADAAQKERLDTEMSAAFSKQGRRSFLINNLQSLAPEAALILHGYCDNDNAPHKNVMVLLTLYVAPADLRLDTTGLSTEENVELYLRNLWGRGLVADKVGALLSRVANNIVVVADEDDEVVKTVCT